MFVAHSASLTFLPSLLRLSVAEPIPPDWEHPSPVHTRSDVQQKRRQEGTPDPSFDVDGDGVVGPKDYFIGKVRLEQAAVYGSACFCLYLSAYCTHCCVDSPIMASNCRSDSVFTGLFASVLCLFSHNTTRGIRNLRISSHLLFDIDGVVVIVVAVVVVVVHYCCLLLTLHTISLRSVSATMLLCYQGTFVSKQNQMVSCCWFVCSIRRA